MPEGPSLVILREEAARFEGQEIMTAEGNTTAFEPAQVIGQPVLSLRTLGKQFIVELPDMAFRVHFMLSGSYRIDNARTARPAWRLALGAWHARWRRAQFLWLLKQVDTDLDAVYDWRADVMSDQWSARKA